MIRWVAEEINRLVVDQGVPSGEIAVLAPFVSDALRFSLQTALQENGIAMTTHRPSRALQVEPGGALSAHPGLSGPSALGDPASLRRCDAGLDLEHPSARSGARAHLLSRIIYPERRGRLNLGGLAN